MGMKEIVSRLFPQREPPIEWRDWVKGCVGKQELTDPQAIILGIICRCAAVHGDLRFEEKKEGVILSVKNPLAKRFRQMSVWSTDSEAFAAVKEIALKMLGPRRQNVFLNSERSHFVFNVSKPNERTIVITAPSLLFPDNVVGNRDEPHDLLLKDYPLPA